MVLYYLYCIFRKISVGLTCEQWVAYQKFLASSYRKGKLLLKVVSWNLPHITIPAILFFLLLTVVFPFTHTTLTHVTTSQILNSSPKCKQFLSLSSLPHSHFRSNHSLRSLLSHTSPRFPCRTSPLAGASRCKLPPATPLWPPPPPLPSTTPTPVTPPPLWSAPAAESASSRSSPGFSRSSASPSTAPPSNSRATSSWRSFSSPIRMATRSRTPTAWRGLSERWPRQSAGTATARSRWRDRQRRTQGLWWGGLAWWKALASVARKLRECLA